jgi:hypothetical protein
MIMKGIAVVFGALVFAGCFAVSNAEAHEEFKNLKVLDGADKKGLEAGMKTLSKGLGVKCNACHVKGEFDSDKIEAKVAARKFLTSTVGEKDTAKRDAALAELLGAMKMEKAKDAKSVWAGVDGFKKK